MSECSSKPSRISRLVQPRKSAIRRTEKRSLSEETAQYRASFLYPPSSVAKRSRSAVGSPLRTPLRTPKTPRPTLLCGGGEQEKRHLNKQSNKVIEILRSNAAPFGRDFLPGGLKTMTTKQFGSVMEYFVLAITGNRFKLGSNTPDDMMAFLTHIQYPYMISKSCFKTPNAPHSYNFIVELLSWLCEFIDYDDFLVFDDEKYIVDLEQSLPDQEYIKFFNNDIRKNFSLWNNQLYEEFEESKAQLVDEYIRRKTVYGSTREIEIKTAEMEKDYIETAQNPIVIKTDNLLAEKQMKMNGLEAELIQLELAVKENKMKLEDLRINERKGAADNDQLKKDVVLLTQSIASQSMSVEERESKISDFNYKKQLTELLKKEIADVQDEGWNDQMRIAQSTKRHIECCAKLHKNLNVMHQTGAKFLGNDINVKDLCNLEEDNFQQQTDSIQLYNTKNMACKSQMELEMVKVRSVLKQTECEIKIVSERHQQLQGEKANFENQIDVANGKIVATKASHNSALENVMKTYETIAQKNEDKDVEVNRLRKVIENSNTDNLNLLENIQKEANQLLDERRRVLTATKAKHEELKVAISELTRNLEDFTE